MSPIVIGLMVLVIIVVVLLVVIAMQPGDFRITRSATFKAPALEVFPHVNDFHKWQAWSPWAKKDPNAKNTYEGPEAGPGAIFRWDGNNDVGQGAMTLTDSRPNELIRIRLEFLKPFQATNQAEFKFAPNGNGTLVTWSMTGTRNFMMKGFCLFMDMDKLVGGDFEKGLANLKSVVEPAA
jgi:hypothetical protein